MKGSSNTNRVTNIRFEGITFSYATNLDIDTRGGDIDLQSGQLLPNDPLPDPNYENQYKSIPRVANVRVESVQNINFERCNFIHLGSVGLDICYSRDSTVRGCVFDDIGSNGIQVLGYVDNPNPTDSNQITQNTLISNNYLSNCGVTNAGAVGIMAGYTQGTTIIHN